MTVTMPIARMMVYLDSIGLRANAIDMSLEVLLEKIVTNEGSNPAGWEHPRKFNRNSIALAALQATLAKAGQGASIVEDDPVYASTAGLVYIVLMIVAL